MKKCKVCGKEFSKIELCCSDSCQEQLFQTSEVLSCPKCLSEKLAYDHGTFACLDCKYEWSRQNEN